ncbi:DNA ligase B [Nocardioides flavus (ex Wang et al. 2016)]|uniref:DNA ligase (ATP) n=1 Tax=Nocardioides flavus (ex Wang et al. 2016) TaxID=2058780 RepID=A0ABQ3HRI5_9ACTN|nr:ATP-dependent DNA ligase [Nocardioides flavus (ex Wang et al. 2016)]GHE19052.1 DNA ligase B [Nocardioides flavus (ex Wang et al. 2016)]
MLLAELVATSAEVSATRSRKAKVVLLAELLGRVEPAELEVVVSYLGGALRQRRTGLGWRGVSDLPAPADQPSLTVLEVHEAFEAMSRLSGPGSQNARKEAVADLFGRATAAEQRWLQAVVTGNVRQGALDAVTQEAVALVAEVPLAAVRRAAMLAGSTVAAAGAAFAGEEALAAIGLEVGRPVLPMLASSAPDVATAMADLSGEGGTEVAIDAKLDGIRIQVHRHDDQVLVVTRSLDDITGRLPEVVDVARSLPAHRFVLDGEALTLGDDGRPVPFQDTASRTAQQTARDGQRAVTPHFFDLLHLDGRDLLDSPGHERLAALDALVPEQHRVRRLVTADPAAADAFATETVAAGHEGVVLKDLSAPYAAGRRGSAWVKVKPVHTLDLVVLAVEWGSGRREGWLSNIHLGARDDSSPTGFVMLGKTFKGMSDEMLTWQTERFLGLETHREGHVVHVRPEQVVEIAFDGLQRSTRYPGGVALRFARVLRYRDDKAPHEADTIATVRSHATG